MIDHLVVENVISVVKKVIYLVTVPIHLKKDTVPHQEEITINSVIIDPLTEITVVVGTAIEMEITLEDLTEAALIAIKAAAVVDGTTSSLPSHQEDSETIMKDLVVILVTEEIDVHHVVIDKILTDQEHVSSVTKKVTLLVTVQITMDKMTVAISMEEIEVVIRDKGEMVILEQRSTILVIVLIVTDSVVEMLEVIPQVAGLLTIIRVIVEKVAVARQHRPAIMIGIHKPKQVISL